MAPLGHSYSLVYSPSSLFPILSPKWPTPFPLIPPPHRAPISTKSAIPLLHPFPGPPQHSSPPSQLQNRTTYYCYALPSRKGPAGVSHEHSSLLTNALMSL